jgi:hypothetical protein
MARVVGAACDRGHSAQHINRMAAVLWAAQPLTAKTKTPTLVSPGDPEIVSVQSGC